MELPLADLGRMSLDAFRDAVAAHNAAQDGQITDMEEDEIAAMMGIA